MIQAEERVKAAFFEFPLTHNAAASAFVGVMMGIGEILLDQRRIEFALIGFDRAINIRAALQCFE